MTEENKFTLIRPTKIWMTEAPAWAAAAAWQKLKKHGFLLAFEQS